MGSDDCFSLEVEEVVHETDEALCVRVDEDETDIIEAEGKRDVWIPKSQVHDDSDVYKLGDSGALLVKSWFATKRGWE